MSLRKLFDDVLNLFLLAQKDKFKGHEVAQILKREIPDEIRSTISASMPDGGIAYKVEGSPGRGQWNSCPWVAIFNTDVTDSAQRGYYPVYLFREDMMGIYLSLNQGVTDIKEQYRSKRKPALIASAKDYRSRLGIGNKEFLETDIDLAPSSRSGLSADYQAGNIVAKYYSADQLPQEGILVADLLQILALYEQLVFSRSSSDRMADEPEEHNNNFIENYAAFRFHRRIERNQAIVAAVKKELGHVCMACGINFAKLYPHIRNHKYIEAHHLTPISTLKGERVIRNPKTDFVVLCANCHRMIHRFKDPSDLEGFRNTLDLSYLNRIVGNRIQKYQN